MTRKEREHARRYWQEEKIGIKDGSTLSVALCSCGVVVCEKAMFAFKFLELG